VRVRTPVEHLVCFGIHCDLSPNSRFVPTKSDWLLLADSGHSLSIGLGAVLPIHTRAGCRAADGLGIATERDRTAGRCDRPGWGECLIDNSGTFIVKMHSQSEANYAMGTRRPTFTVAGPWSFLPGGTGRYSKISGSGDLGVVIDSEHDPWTGEELFVELD
jgi:hypothetical protein